jgi:hypothetical protein
VLPALADRDIYASGEELEQLEAEVKVLQASLRAVVDELLANGVHIVHGHAWVVGMGWQPGVDPYETILVRLSNIAEAVRLARGMPNGEGEVVIW